jgi:hypothetical protein
MGQRRVKVYDLAVLLKISHGQASLRLAGRVPFLCHERNRISEHLGLTPDWLFAPLAIPQAARLSARPGAGRECGVLPRAAETLQEPIQDGGLAMIHAVSSPGAVTLEEFGAAFTLNLEQQDRLRNMRECLAPDSKLLPEVDELVARAERIQHELALLFGQQQTPLKA